MDPTTPIQITRDHDVIGWFTRDEIEEKIRAAQFDPTDCFYHIGMSVPKPLAHLEFYLGRSIDLVAPTHQSTRDSETPSVTADASDDKRRDAWRQERGKRPLPLKHPPDSWVTKERKGLTPSQIALSIGAFALLLLITLGVAKGVIALVSNDGTNSPASTRQATKEQWLRAAPITSAGTINCAPDLLFAQVGRPDRTQQLGQEMFLYWTCRDGTIQVVCRSALYNRGLVAGTINHY